ncbi:Ulp1-like peptidase [Cucumis melo var. makuwa]|uniref:Ulp1-like peptidase n=1 Tax=Cucumis melo var. makuwa TaxID=1194695 RepID=A0A5A7T951_CUCMM|nr:Ulp1-like peptidase [Cucumis melo var. makuwa]
MAFSRLHLISYRRHFRREFNIITGLWGPKEDYIQLVGNSRLLEKFFKDKECIYVSDLEDIFLEYEDDDDDIVKLALVYFIEISLLGKDRRTKVDIGFFKIADDWNTFNNYDWGRIVFERTLSALKRALDKQYAKGKKKSTQTKKYTINGFPHALQVWAYESIPTIIGCGVDKVNDHAIPRMLRWVCQQSPKSQTISQVFDSLMFIIKAVIEMTPEEKQLKIASAPLNKRTDDELRETFHGKKSKHLDALFLFIRLKIKAAGIPSSQNFTTADTIFMLILVSKWPLYKECIKENRPFDWDEEYRLVDYVVGSKEDFQDPWASVDYVYSPFNVHGNHWVLLCLDLVSCQVKVWDSLPSLTTAEEMTNILLPIRQLVPKLLDSTGFFDRRGRSSTYKEHWPVVIVDSIPLQRNNSDCGVFTIKYFEYIAAGVGLDTLCQENMSYFRKQLAFQLWTNTPMY